MSNQTNEIQRSRNPSSIGFAKSFSRIAREYNDIAKDPSNYWCAYPLNLEDPYEWHFTIKGPSKTEFEGGLYHGRITLPTDYPFSPPSIILLTPNGRFQVGKKVCLNASNYHPELWQPTWGIRVILGALSAFFPSQSEGAINSLDWPPELRRKLATDSVKWKCAACQMTNQDLIEKYCSNDPVSHLGPQNATELEQSEVNFHQYDDPLQTENETINVPEFLLEEEDSPDISHYESPPEKQTITPNKRLRPQQTQTSILNQLIFKPSNGLEKILLLIDTLLAIFLLLLIVGVASIVVEIVGII